MTLRRVLVVEDDAPFRKMICRELELRFETVAAASFDEAMMLLDAGPDLFADVSDYRLGSGRRGDELLAVVARRWPRCVRVLISGSASAAGAASACHFVKKPWEPGAVLAKLEQEAR
jgi:ActR/RegA family two-component response regulator